MATKTRLTPDDHTDMGRTLAAIRDELIHRRVRLENAYPRTGTSGLPARKLAAAARALDEARSVLDSALFREHPDTAETTVYYPHPEDRPPIPAALRRRGSRPSSVVDAVPCPACSAASSYVREMDRYVHSDGSENRACWLAITRGEAPVGLNVHAAAWQAEAPHSEHLAARGRR